ncbi:MAG: SCO family protein [Gammaproteobacteria bacterium]
MPSVSRMLPWVLGAAVMLSAFAAGVWLSARQGPNPGAIEGLLWPDPPLLADFHLSDQRGLPFTPETLRGRWSLVFFGFTHCPDVCPTSLEVMARAAQALEENALWRERGQVVFVSIDPERDDAEALASYVGYFSPDFLGVTGAESELRALTRSVGALFHKVAQGEGRYTMDHSAGIFFVGPDLRLVSVITPPHNAAAIVRRFETVSAFIDRQG